MPFKYNPPTRTTCKVCDELIARDTNTPIIDSHNGKASSANNFAFHNWYNFVLGYSPEFPNYILDKEKIKPTDLVADPFMGSGTTLVACKFRGIPSIGIDANDFMVDAARTKLNWDIDIKALKRTHNEILQKIDTVYNSFNWQVAHQNKLIQQDMFVTNINKTSDYRTFAQENRPEMLLEKYICDQPYAKLKLIYDVIVQTISEGPLLDIFELALTSIIVPVSNVRYGPGFGVGKPKEDVDVLSIFNGKVSRMITDLQLVDDVIRSTPSHVSLGDARAGSKSFEPNSASLIITSPPYPGDHEYTKHTRLELIFKGYATNKKEFQIIKKRMLTASTTNIYKEDNDKESVSTLESIGSITDLIQKRLTHDGATSGFEKLYTKLVWEYFGGMYKSLFECFQILKPGGKIALLISDSHAFKMVHIQTAEILKEIGENIGYVKPEIVLWQLKSSTSHKYYLRENILILKKPQTR